MNKNSKKIIRVGSRKSELALIQTKFVINELEKFYPSQLFEIHTMSTIGDRILNVSLPKIGEKSLFTRDLEDALKHGRVDFIVHSLKDLPTTLPPGMVIGAVLQREDARDALVLNEKYKGCTLQTLPKGAIIGTSSLRRTAQIRRKYPHLEIIDIRGNLNTRLAKLDSQNSKFAGIILAQAGLVRMGWMNRISQILEPEDLLYCVGQGALAVECRVDDKETLSMLEKLMCLTTTCKTVAERSFLKTLGGGCSAPVAVFSSLKHANFDELKIFSNATLALHGAVWSLDGRTEIKDGIVCPLEMRKRKKIEEYSTTEDEDEDENMGSSKRIKITKQFKNDKRSSPEIFNDDPVVENLISSDLQYIINVHGRLFKKCPFYHLHMKDRENGTTSTKKEECPLNLEIGQDFMGQCPYVDIENKVEMTEKGICPITGKQFSEYNKNCDDSENKINSENTNLNMGDKANNNVHEHLLKSNLFNSFHDKNEETLSTGIKKGECPMKLSNFLDNKFDKSKQSSKEQNISDTFNNENHFEEIKNVQSHETCPFLQKIKCIEHSDEGKSNEILNDKTYISEEEPIEEFKDIFCGIFRPKCYDKILFKKCDDLGRHLARNLISKGALNVMKVAQDEIHKGTVINR